jgi:hypothetical protein
MGKAEAQKRGKYLSFNFINKYLKINSGQR